MSRSRSSFDLDSAIATAASLSVPEAEADAGAPYRTMALVSFGPNISGPPTVLPDPLPVAHLGPQSTADGASIDETVSSDAARRPPKLPDLSGVVSPIVRCERIVEWISDATGASDVFLADGVGLPIAGAVDGAESRLAGAGLVASSITQLAASIPGNASSLFELHIGEGPFFQLVGFEVASALYVVGLTRATPLTYRQAHAIRLACRHALGETIVPSRGVRAGDEDAPSDGDRA